MLERLIEPYDKMMEARIVRPRSRWCAATRRWRARTRSRRWPPSPTPRSPLLMLAQVTDDEAQVVAMMEKFLKTYPKANEVRAAYARVLVNRKDYPAARREFEALLKVQPDNAATLYALGILATQTEDAAGAETYFTRFVDVLGRNPNDERDPSRALLILSQLAEERGDLAGALLWLNKVPDNTDEQTRFNAQLRRAHLTGKGGDLAARVRCWPRSSRPSRRARPR